MQVFLWLGCHLSSHRGNPEGLGAQRTLALAPVSEDTLGVRASRQRAAVRQWKNGSAEHRMSVNGTVEPWERMRSVTRSAWTHLGSVALSEKARPQGHVVCDSVHVEFPEQADLETQGAGQWLRGAGE